MTEQNKKCPECGQGLMKTVSATDPLTETPKDRPMQVRCDNPKCGFEDDYTKHYPIGSD